MHVHLCMHTLKWMRQSFNCAQVHILRLCLSKPQLKQYTTYVNAVVSKLNGSSTVQTHTSCLLMFVMCICMHPAAGDHCIQGVMYAHLTDICPLESWRFAQVRRLRVTYTLYTYVHSNQLYYYIVYASSLFLPNAMYCNSGQIMQCSPPVWHFDTCV